MGVDPEQIKNALNMGEEMKFLSVDEVMFNLVQINEWFERMGELYENLHHHVKLSRSVLEQLGEKDLSMKLDLAAESFSVEFYGAFEDQVAEERENPHDSGSETGQQEDPEDGAGP